MAKGIHIPRCREGIHPVPFHRQKARIGFIFLRAGQIYGLVGDIEIAAHHNGLVAPQFFRIIEKRAEKAHLVRHTFEHAFFQLFSAVGEIAVEIMKLFKFQVKDTAFPLVVRVGQFVFCILRFNTAEYRHAGISFFYGGRTPPCVPALRRAVCLRDLFGSRLGFLKAHNVGVCSGKPRPFGLPAQGSESVDIPGGKTQQGHGKSNG